MTEQAGKTWIQGGTSLRKFCMKPTLAVKQKSHMTSGCLEVSFTTDINY
jgi:hypothetical protein